MNRTNKSQIAIFIALFHLMVHPLEVKALNAQEEKCFLEKAQDASDETTIGEIKDKCVTELDSNKSPQATSSKKLSRIDQRIRDERATLENPAVITAHKRSYMLPITHVKEPNRAPFSDLPNDYPLDNVEAKFQLSFKAPLFSQLFDDQDVLFFGFTLQSYWQVYNSELSSPFRETNYQPEIFYAIENDTKLREWTNKAVIFGIEHQSNGRTQSFSRSWNRIYANFVFERDDWVIAFKPWYRLSEKAKTDPSQPDGDDNPDIEDYMGYFELSTIYSWDDQNFSLMLRNNLRSKNRGAIQMDWTFPLGKRFKGYLQYFNGYGESLIDYDHNIERIGFGVALTDFF